MAERTDVDCVRNLVSMLMQSEQFGTSIAKTLRMHSDTLRTQRVQPVEEAAAKTTIKLIFPLVFFIFPVAVSGRSGTRGHHHDGFIQSVVQQLRKGGSVWTASRSFG